MSSSSDLVGRLDEAVRRLDFSGTSMTVRHHRIERYWQRFGHLPSPSMTSLISSVGSHLEDNVAIQPRQRPS